MGGFKTSPLRIHWRTHFQVTALHLAAASGDLNGFRELIEAKEPPFQTAKWEMGALDVGKRVV